MQRKPFTCKSAGDNYSTRRLQLVHSDICGPMQIEFIGGCKYFVTFIDDYSRCCAVYFLKRKSEVLKKFKEFKAIVTDECDQSIATPRTDNGGEYLSREFQGYLKLKGIRHELTIAHTPEQNGVSERMNRTLMESAIAMIVHAGLSKEYWAKAVATAAYMRNRTATSALKEDKTPHEKWYERKPDISHLKVFGCAAYLNTEGRGLDGKAEKLYFVGYCKNSKGYRLLDEKTRKILKRRDVTFNESKFDLGKTKSETVKDVTVDLESETSVKEQEQLRDEQPRDEPQQEEPHCSEREHRPPNRYGFSEYADTAKVDHLAYNMSNSEIEHHHSQ